MLCDSAHTLTNSACTTIFNHQHPNPLLSNQAIEATIDRLEGVFTQSGLSKVAPLFQPIFR